MSCFLSSVAPRALNELPGSKPAYGSASSTDHGCLIMQLSLVSVLK